MVWRGVVPADMSSRSNRPNRSAEKPLLGATEKAFNLIAGAGHEVRQEGKERLLLNKKYLCTWTALDR